MKTDLQFSDLRKDDTFAEFPLSVTLEEVQAYLESTGESVALWAEHVPPLFLDALVVAELLSQVKIPKGVMHTGQEHESHRAARIGETLTVRMRVASLSERRGVTLAAFEADARDASDAPVATMRISVMVAPDGVTV
ncbi:MAG: MaoC family dehydratase N-terminal domain-containing protein [Chloroflexi bacterium]|nr:MaoC family dehydratase N-terminal domain-containing protein [Chloroflexota bacterium]MDA1239279.1 MaoC family dehydratase N-terminal domain-containing protein [Chloroflexota bacterium]